MNLSAEVLRGKLALNASDYDFYHCYKCGRLITRVDEILFFTPGSKTYGNPCKCGSRKYQACNPRWYDYLRWKVIKFAYYRIRGIA